jgi:hypothetical protein
MAQALPEVGIVGTFGFRRKGKTATLWDIVEKQANQGRQAVALYPRFLIDEYLQKPRSRSPLIPRHIKLVSRLEELKEYPGAIVLADEMALQAHAREHATSGNIEWVKFAAIGAQFGQLQLQASQSTRQLDVGLVMDVDRLIIKQPSLLHIRFSRPELRPELQDAYDRFQEQGKKKRNKDPRGWAYVWDAHEGQVGFVKTGLPSFWSNELSTIFTHLETDSPAIDVPAEVAAA